jgi:hypothetical protein
MSSSNSASDPQEAFGYRILEVAGFRLARDSELELDDVVSYEPDAQVAEAIHAEIVSVVQDPEPVRPDGIDGYQEDVQVVRIRG